MYSRVVARAKRSPWDHCAVFRQSYFCGRQMNSLKIFCSFCVALCNFKLLTCFKEMYIKHRQRNNLLQDYYKIDLLIRTIAMLQFSQ